MISSLLTAAVGIIKLWQMRIVFGDFGRTGDEAVLAEKLNKTIDFSFPTEIRICNAVLYGQIFFFEESFNRLQIRAIGCVRVGQKYYHLEETCSEIMQGYVRQRLK